MWKTLPSLLADDSSKCLDVTAEYVVICKTRDTIDAVNKNTSFSKFLI